MTRMDGEDTASEARPTRRDILGRALRLGGGLLAVGAIGLRPGAGSTAGPAQAQDPNTAIGMRFMRIGTGSTAGTYFPIGGLIASAISRPPGARPCERGGSCGVPGLIAVAQSTGGSVDNVGLLRSGAVDMALCQADVAYWARTGSAAFEDTGPMPGLLALARLYEEKIHLVVRADGDIERVEDLRQRRIAMGELGSGTLVDARLLLAAHGLTEVDILPVYDKPGPAADLLAAGEIDAFFFIGSAPVPVVAALARSVPVRLIGLSGPVVRTMADTQPYLTQGVVPGGLYTGVPRAVPTLSVGAVLVATDAMDTDMAYGVVRGLWHPNVRAQFQDDVVAGTMTPAKAPHGTGIPLHPGAQRYYEDEGYLP
ncbi:TAXI family TRAP transporter solute-binding subunit [Roseospira navarrensis]|uniref:TAXI family TRAP transporter solute-binding subunit n=1 Tax=Roseospira navarrensis TaxID=140058 RepID=A0A7X1ZFU9_9PROT|nr:TAXI family TRAP transporter solute-binding subunit [Roseospira navarrensis]MQX37751.1 TAXI family TRAP transporter solute-binding subunit [Roseospira navarrensis]